MNEYKIEYKNIVYSRRLNNSLSVQTIVSKAACQNCISLEPFARLILGPISVRVMLINFQPYDKTESVRFSFQWMSDESEFCKF